MFLRFRFRYRLRRIRFRFRFPSSLWRALREQQTRTEDFRNEEVC